MMGMTFADDGFVQIGDDGVVRSWNGEGEVIDYVRLDNAELLDSLSAVARVQDEAKLVEAYSRLATANGYSVPDDEVFNPPAHIKPSRFSDDTAMEKRTANAKVSANPAQVLGKRQMPAPPRPPRCHGRACFDTAACRTVGCSQCMIWSGSVVNVCVWGEYLGSTPLPDPDPFPVCPFTLLGCW